MQSMLLNSTFRMIYEYECAFGATNQRMTTVLIRRFVLISIRRCYRLSKAPCFQFPPYLRDKRSPLISSYLRYLLHARNAHGLHSPFVYELYNEVIRDTRHYYAYDRVEALRARMLVSDQVIRVTDFGTGAGQPAARKAAFIARRYATPQRFARLLFRLVNRARPVYILEMGTSLGITTAYLAAANSASQVVTLASGLKYAWPDFSTVRPFRR